MGSRDPIDLIWILGNQIREDRGRLSLQLNGVVSPEVARVNHNRSLSADPLIWDKLPNCDFFLSCTIIALKSCKATS